MKETKVLEQDIKREEQEEKVEDIKFKKKTPLLKIRPIFIIALSFILLIFLGSILLSLPAAYENPEEINYLDALFTSTSCCCVTGLSTLANGSAATYSLFGEIVMMILIQLGGLGVTTFVLVLFVLSSRTLSQNNKTLIKESWNIKSFNGIKALFFGVFLVHFVFESFGTLFIFLDLKYIHGFETGDALFKGLFLAISSFNNAGFDLFGTTSLIAFESDWLLMIIISILIICGGIGYLVIIDVVRKRFNFHKLSLGSKVALVYSGVLLLSGWLIIFFSEFGNANSNVTFLNAFSLSVSSRTAGFSTNNLKDFRSYTLIFIIILMFIGASPSGTAGGVKTTTIAVFMAYLRSVASDKSPHLFRRKLRNDNVRNALFLILLAFLFSAIGTVLILIFENGNFDLIDIMFESMSAFSTTGLSTGITPSLNASSKIILISLMYIGRVGPLSISTLFKSGRKQNFHYVEEEITVG